MSTIYCGCSDTIRSTCCRHACISAHPLTVLVVACATPCCATVHSCTTPVASLQYLPVGRTHRLLVRHRSDVLVIISTEQLVCSCVHVSIAGATVQRYWCSGTTSVHLHVGSLVMVHSLVLFVSLSYRAGMTLSLPSPSVSQLGAVYHATLWNSSRGHMGLSLSLCCSY